jgi:hypothetical protein
VLYFFKRDFSAIADLLDKDIVLAQKLDQEWPGDVEKIGRILSRQHRFFGYDSEGLALGDKKENLLENVKNSGRNKDRLISVRSANTQFCSLTV